MPVPIDLSLCGVDLKIQGIDNAMLDIEKKLGELTSQAKGIAGSLSSIQGDLQNKLSIMKNEMEALIPEIKIELPNLQVEMNKLLGQLDSPIDFSSQLNLIKEKFGNIPNVDIDDLVNQLKSNPLGFDPCKNCPNFDVEPQLDDIGKIIGYTPIKKGEKPTLPVTDAKKLPTPPSAKKEEEVKPAKDQTVTAKITPEDKKLLPPTLAATEKPAQKSKIGAAETITVDWPDLYKDIVKLKQKTGQHVDDYEIRPVVFTKNNDYWKPAMFPTQLAFEEYIVLKVFLLWSYAKQRINAINETSDDVKAIQLAKHGEKWNVDNYKQLSDACIKFVRNGLSYGEGLEGTHTREGNNFSVNIEQAKRSAVPKPAGEFGTNSSILV